jgi:hypothetical protein
MIPINSVSISVYKPIGKMLYLTTPEEINLYVYIVYIIV